MHSTRTFLLGLFAVLAAIVTTAAETNLPASTATIPARPKIGIMKFEVDTDLKPSLATALYQGFSDRMINSGKFTVVEWEQMDRLQKLVAQAQPNVSPEDARKMAIHQLGIEKLYLGSLSKLGSTFYVGMKVLNLDLTVERSERVSAASEEDLERAIGRLVDLLLGRQDIVQPMLDSGGAVTRPATSTGGFSKAKPFVNSLGMRFVPMPNTKVLFCVWETRVKDFEAFVNDTHRDMGNSMRVVGSDGYKERAGYNWQKPGFRQTPDHPVVGVNWNDAVAFCEWLTKKERNEGKINRNQSYRLPIDEEWSEAVGLHERPGGLPRDKSGKVGDQYPWGRSWPPPRGAGNYAGSEARTDTWPSDWKTIESYSDEYSRTAPVGSFEANEFGLFDLGGNAWEWCEDRYDNEHDWRVLRGASWQNIVTERVLSSFRGFYTPGYRDACIGFRCVLVVGGAPSE
ncbi:MAG: SUMF1/EgtB/PvdO family nonheme iron enzyme [Verrucomicrobia bacterium]|nr:SUMF1/EgtB/PvdO family nonheme iron enzyme [Verrucomicrobiota bacterium]